MVKTIMLGSDFESLINEVKNKLLNPEQCGGPYFNGDEVEFEEWAGDALSDAIEYALNEVGIEIDWDGY